MESTSWRPESGPQPIWVDFNDMPASGIVGLNMPGTMRELAARGIELREGLVLNVWDADGDEHNRRDDLIATGVVERHGEKWYLAIGSSLRHQSDDRR